MTGQRVNDLVVSFNLIFGRGVGGSFCFLGLGIVRGGIVVSAERVGGFVEDKRGITAEDAKLQTVLTRIEQKMGSHLKVKGFL